eukprot:COSAG01_NODE_1709_length_9424_cov_50.603968_4_plen_106_part_00
MFSTILASIPPLCPVSCVCMAASCFNCWSRLYPLSYNFVPSLLVPSLAHSDPTLDAQISAMQQQQRACARCGGRRGGGGAAGGGVAAPYWNLREYEDPGYVQVQS